MWNSALARIIKLFLVCLLQLSFFNSITAQPIVSFVPFLTGLSSPVDIVSSEDGTDRMFIVEQSGRIRVFKDSVRAAPFLDLRSVISTGGEMGLLSLAFHPRYDTNRYFFVYYTTQSGPITSINIARIRTQAGDAFRADSLSRVVLLSIPKPANQTNHNGGKLIFGPDGKLYFGTGDGGSANDPFDLAQNGNSLLGKMLRIEVDSFNASSYYIPPDNPFVTDASILDEIWAMGLRNPWRWSFDRLTNDVWIGDVGQGAREEVNFRVFANSDSVNYGWRCFEGLIDNNGAPDCIPPRYLPPIFDYPHVSSNGGFSITGGYVYRGTQYPDLYGYYLTADYVSGNGFLIKPDGIGGWDTTLLKGVPGSVSGFGESESGELYMASLTAGIVYRVTASGPLPVALLNFTAKELNGYNELKWNTSFEENTVRFIIEYANDGRSFQIAGEVLAMNNITGYSYSFRHNIPERKKLFYRLKIIDFDGKSKYSPIISVGGDKSPVTRVYPTIIRNNIINIITDLPVNSVKVYTMFGKEVYINNLNGAQGYFSIRLPQLAKGTYIVNIAGRDYLRSEKVVIQ